MRTEAAGDGICQTFTVGQRVGEPDRQPSGGPDEHHGPVGSGEGGDAPVTGPDARSTLEVDPIMRAAMVRREWAPTRPSTGVPWKKQALWFVVAVLAGSMFALILWAIN